MKKPARLLFCLVAPLQAGNILFLAKQRHARLAVPLLRLHLRLFHSRRLGELARDPASAPPGLSGDIIAALGCLGFIHLNNQLRGTLKTESAIRENATDDRQYIPAGIAPDKKLERLLRGKSVAIVGPSTGADNQAEIDNFDIVVRMGYTGPEGFPDKTGTRCDVSFYAPHKMRSIVATNRTGALESLELAVIFKLHRYTKYGINLAELGLPRERIAMAILPPFRLTIANTLVKALYNCLLCHPQKIKVFNADLFLSSEYPAGYIANKRTVADSSAWSYENRGMCKSFAINHNPAEQLEFYKHFFHRGAFEADARLTEIINMPVETYIDKLDALYGAPLRQHLGL